MSCKVHRVRFYNPQPKSINCISYNKANKHVAIAREDASIEIWDLNYAPYLLKFIPGTEKGSIEALGWVNERLLSTGLGGALLEWDLDKLVLKKTIQLTGYAAWCLDVDPKSTRVAVGTEQGYINLYSVEDEDIVYQKLFDKQEGRILCCKFNNTGNVLVTGSVDSIRVWNVVTGQALSRISARRGGNETIVWCVAALSDNTVVSGDSHGRLTFWDISTGDQIDSYITHKADILSLTVSDNERSLYCSGADPVIVNFVKVDSERKGQSQWVKNVQRHIHQHGVRGLALQGDKLVSCGEDGYVTLSSYPPKWVQRVPPLPPAPRSALSPAKRLLLLKYNNHLEVWRLGSHETRDNGELVPRNVSGAPLSNGQDSRSLEPDTEAGRGGSVTSQPLRLREAPLKLAAVAARGGRAVRCCDLAPSGELLVYATEACVRVLRLEVDEETNTTSITKVPLSGAPASCDAVAFGADSESLVLHSGGALSWLQVDAAGGAVLHTIDTAPHLKSSSLLHLKLWSSEGRTYIVAADAGGGVAVWARTAASIEHHATLPRYHAVPSALSVDASGNILAVYVDQKLIEYNIERREFSSWARAALPPAWYGRAAAARGVTSHPARAAAVVQDEASLWILDRDADESKGSPRKKKANTTADANVSLRVVPIKYLCDFHWLSPSECVAVELRPARLVARLPPPAPRRCLPYAD